MIKPKYPLSYIRRYPNKATYEICYRAVQERSSGITHVPERFIDEKMCIAAASSEGYAVAYIPRPLRTREVWLAALQSRGTAIQFLPKDQITAEYCIFAFRDWSAMHLYWHKIEDNQLIIVELIKAYPHTLKHITNPTKDMIQLHKMLWEV